MKKLVLSLALATFTLAQMQAVVVYNDFAPDLTMALGGSLSFDLDGDMNDDITFTSTGTGGSDYVISASGTQVEFAAQGGGGMAYTETLFVGKLVDASKNWAAGNARIASAANKDIAGGNEFYIGLRVVGNNNNYFYGWLLVEVKANQELVIKSSAFETSNPKIVVGNTGAALLSTEEVEATEFKLFPNTVSEELQIEASETLSQVEIHNLSGQLVKVIALETKEASLNLSDLSKGTYLISIKTAKGELHQERFVKL